jgi:hypothetical protein
MTAACTSHQTSRHNDGHTNGHTNGNTTHRATARQRRWLAPLLLALAGNAHAHDTWFAPLPPGPQGELVLALGTGARFPRQETPLDKGLVRASGCQVRGAPQPAATTALLWVSYRTDAMVLRSAQSTQPHLRHSCWLEAQPLSITLDDATVTEYLDEIRALPVVRDRWSDLQRHGKGWQERYVKHARIELQAAAPSAASAGLPGQAGGTPGLDLQADMPAGPLRAGDTLRVRLLRDGQPLAGLPLILRNDLSPLALWHRSDADGWITAVLPLAARWLLSGVDLRPSATDPDGWDSRFVSLHLETLPLR